MTKDKDTYWPIQPHTQAKHLILRKYLDAWLPIMAKWNGRILFIDGFAGPGRYEEEEEGSPIIALRSIREHRQFQEPKPRREVVFFFIEKEGDRINALKEEIERFKNSGPLPAFIKYHVLHGEFVPIMTEILDTLGEESKLLAPTFVFIDPFGYKDLPLKIIARIVNNPRCECLITFMYSRINRFINSADAQQEEYFDQLFATKDWRTFRNVSDPDERRIGITNLYRLQLIEYAGLKYVRTFEMINEGNQTEYFLFFGTSDKKGLSKMKEAMWRVDPMLGQSFSDNTDSRQIVFLADEVNYEHIKDLLMKRFSNKGWVSIKEVEDFVLFDTPYSEKIHLKRKTLAPMERESPSLINVQGQAGSRRRAGTYPDGTLIEFL